MADQLGPFSFRDSAHRRAMDVANLIEESTLPAALQGQEPDGIEIGGLWYNLTTNSLRLRTPTGDVDVGGGGAAASSPPQWAGDVPGVPFSPAHSPITALANRTIFYSQTRDDDDIEIVLPDITLADAGTQIRLRNIGFGAPGILIIRPHASDRIESQQFASTVSLNDPEWKHITLEADGINRWLLVAVGDPMSAFKEEDEVGTDFRPILPTSVNVVDYWIADQGVTPTAWTGQLRGLVLNAVGAPSLGTDDLAFRGRPVVKTSDGNGYRGVFSAVPLLDVGTRPYVFSCFRRVAAPAVAGTVFGPARVNEAELMGIELRFNGESTLLSLQAHYTGVHTYDLSLGGIERIAEAWADDVGDLHLSMDGVDQVFVISGNSYQLATEANAIGIGISGSAPVNFTTTNHAFHMICDAPPTEAERQTLRNWARNTWITPP